MQQPAKLDLVETTEKVAAPAPPVLLTEEQAAAAIGLSQRFLQARRYRGDGPRFVRISSRCVRYRRQDLEAWIQARVRSSTSES